MYSSEWQGDGEGRASEPAGWSRMNTVVGVVVHALMDAGSMPTSAIAEKAKISMVFGEVATGDARVSHALRGFGEGGDETIREGEGRGTGF